MFTSARWGSLASFGARAYPRHQEVVRHERQQLRGGGRVRRPGEGQGGHRRRPEQRARLEALQRSGRALRDRQPARRLLLSRSSSRATPSANTSRGSRIWRFGDLMSKATGTFDVKITPQASDLAPEGPNLGRMSLDKQFHGDLIAAAKGEMITAAGLAVKESAAYSAVERVTGTLHGKKGSFALQHTGIMDRGKPSLHDHRRARLGDRVSSPASPARWTSSSKASSTRTSSSTRYGRAEPPDQTEQGPGSFSPLTTTCRWLGGRQYLSGGALAETSRPFSRRPPTPRRSPPCASPPPIA